MTAEFQSRIKTDKNGEYIIVVSGDTLSHIALEYFGDANKYPQLATLNKLNDANFIVVGQKIYLSKTSTGDTPSSTPVNSRGVTITQFGLLAGGVTNELYATWTWHREGDTSEYDIEWKWYRMGVWKYQDSTEIRRYSTFTIPDDGITSKIQFRVRPVPKVDKINDKDVKRFEDNLWSDWNECTYLVVNKPDAPTQVTVSLDKLALTASVTNPGTSKASLIKFQLITDNNLETATIKRVSVNDSLTVISHTFNVDPGHSYTVRACANKDGNDSDWSAISNSVESMPAKVTLNDPKPTSSTTVELSWSASRTAESYTLSYVSGTNGFFEGDDGHQDKTGITGTTYTIEVTPGVQYSFKVKAVKGQEESDWSEVKTVTLGTDPTSPTTWSSTTTAISDEGESVALYWVHNTTDGSAQQSADVILTIEGIDDILSVSGGDNVSVPVGELKNTNARPYYKVTYDAEKKTYTETKTLFTPGVATDTPIFQTTDGGRPVYSVTVNGEVVYYYRRTDVVIYTVTAATSDSNPNPTHSLIINTKNYTEGAKITWNVTTTSTAGKTSDASVDRVIEIFYRPTVRMSVSNGNIYYKVEYMENTKTYITTEETLSPLAGSPVSGGFTVEGNRQVYLATVDDEDILYCVAENGSLTSLPISVNVEVEANEAVQMPIEYHIVVSSNEKYDTVDNFGNQITISEGESIFSKHYIAPSTSQLSIEISAKDITLENGRSYTVKCIVAMSSGINAEAFSEVHISWSAVDYELNAQIGVNTDNCSASVRPYCERVNRTYRRVINTGSIYYLDTEQYDYIYGSITQPTVFTTTGESVYFGTLATGEETYYAIVDEHIPVTDVLLSVYRREYDGSYTPIIEDLDGSKESFVTDPHPALDYARYRIVAKDLNTSKVTYSDTVNYYIGEKAIIIQWDEPYSSFEVSEDGLGIEDRSRSFLRLPYNIDVTNSKDPDVTLVKYVGRKHPVSYYGTHLGEKASWSTTVPKSDLETLYALQRLQSYTGDVYVREPHGTGYWANVKVAFARAHLETTVPVSLDIVRVEGGA